MKIVFWNILSGGTGRADPLAEVLLAQRADIVLLAEATDPDVTDRIAWRLRMDLISGAGLAVLTPHDLVATAVTPEGLLVRVRSAGFDVTLLAIGEDRKLVMLPSGVSVVAGNFDPAALSGFFGELREPTYPTLQQTERRDFILARSPTIRSRVETDRLARFASDHFPVVSEME